MLHKHTARFSIALAFVLAGSALPAQIEPGLDQDLDGLLPPAGVELSRDSREIRKAVSGNQVLAEEKAKALLRADPGNWEGLYWLGLIEVRRGDAYSAVRHLSRARELHPSATVAKVLGVAYYLVRQHRLFQKMMAEAAHDNPEDFASYYYLGRFYESDLNDSALAAVQFQKAVERNPTHFRSHYHLGFTFEATGEPQRAETEYRRAIDVAGRAGLATFAQPWLGLARLRFASGRHEEALEYARKAVAMIPQDAAARQALGKILSALNRHAEAAREWEAAAALDPTDTSTLYRLYQVYQLTGDRARAEAALTRYRKIASVYGPN